MNSASLSNYSQNLNDSSLVLHIPHASTHIPASVRPTLLLSDSELQQELLQITDAHTDELFGCERATTVRYAFSRLVVDPERFEDDSLEPMSQLGMGVVYERTSGGLPLRRTPTSSQREELLNVYYRPHHNQLTNAAANAMAQYGRCLIIDCHSFPARPLAYEFDQRLERPDICIGTDSHHTPPEIVAMMIAGFQEAGFSVDVNRPFAGSMVPAPYYRRNAKVCSLMIEANRAMYMNEATGQKSKCFDEARDVISRVIQDAVIKFEKS